MSLELDLRGRRADEVEVLLDNYLNDAAVSNLKRVRIIHGYGTGTVRSIVRDFASHHPLVKNFEGVPTNEGGDGVTVINLR
jgi:DNA mismatch repair protein MutS2